MPNKKKNRRSFLKATAVAGTAAVAIPYFVNPSAAAAANLPSPKEKMKIGLIGAGGMGMGNMNSAKDWVDVVAIADADKTRQQRANERLSGGKADMYDDYRKILERDDIKILHIATPDHWHTKPLIEAMLAGKDVYCEKPLTLTIDEGKKIRKVQKDTGRIVQVGTQQRSTFNLFTKAVAIAKAGRLGKIKRIQCAIGGAPSSKSLPVADVPEGLDWERWLGPAPFVDYRSSPVENGKRASSNCHYEFRWWYQYSGGKLTDWGAHHVDIANWALKASGNTDGPIGIKGTSEHPMQYMNGVPLESDRYNTATKFNFTVDYPGGVEVVIRNDTDNGVLIEGDKGRIFVNRSKLVGKPVEDLEANPLPEGTLEAVYKNLPMEHNERRAHWANFIHCHREQVEPISDVHSHMEMLNLCHLAGICARVERPLKWDNSKEEIVGDELANSFLSRPYREGYEIQM